MNKQQSVLIIGAIAAIVTLMSVSVLSDNHNVQAQLETSKIDSSKDRIISVSGVASASVKPDLLIITFGMQSENKTAKESLDANSKAMNGVIEAIKSAGIKENEISTSQFNIYPVYDYYDDQLTHIGKQVLRGYQVTNTITVKTGSLGLAADIIDGAVGAGANRVDSVSFTLAPETQAKIKDDLIEKAITNAKTKAEKALSPLDQQIIGVKSVSLSDFSLPPPIPFYGVYDKAGASSTPIFSSDQDVSTSANVEFLMGSK